MTHRLLIECVDAPGIVHKVSGALFRAGFNIVRNHEFVDQTSGRFFMRTEFLGDADSARVADEVRGLLAADATVRLADSGPRSVVILATSERHCLGELLLRHEGGELRASILAVVSNHDTLRGLVTKFDVPFHFVSHDGLSREAHESAMLEVIGTYSPDYLILAKYMRILGSGFVRAYPNRMINIHHSFLPAFIGAEPYKQAFARGVKIIGATAHFVTEELDDGPIIAQSVFPVDHTQSPREMAQAGRDIEKLVLARALTLVLEDRVFLCGNKTIIFD